MTTPTPEEAELAALDRINAAVAAHNVAALAETLAAERANLRPEGRAFSQLGHLLTVLSLCPVAFARERGKLDAQLNPPPEEEAVVPDPAAADPPAAPEGE